MSTRRDFETTQWSLILTAADRQNPESRQALSELCQTYWHPVFSFFRGRGLDESTAGDLTQEFFTMMLEKRSLEAADPHRGRFRSFLLACAKNFLANWRSREKALKRGGRVRIVGLETLQGRTEVPKANGKTDPTRLFEKQWALTLLSHVMKKLEAEQAKTGSLERFRLLRVYLTQLNTGLRYGEVAEKLDTTPAAIKTAVYRLRQRFAELLRLEVLQTVEDPGEVESEIRFLMEALSD